MLLINQRLDKLASLTVELVHHGLLPCSHLPPPEVDPFDTEKDDEGPLNGMNTWQSETCENSKFGLLDCAFPHYLAEIAEQINFPNLGYLIRRFLYEQLQDNTAPCDIDPEDLPSISSKIDVFNSAIAEFYAPSDVAGIRGMRCERIWCTNSWCGSHCKGCVHVVTDKDKPGLKGMDIVRMHLLFSFKYEGTTYPCVLVQWYKRVGRAPDPNTGMWMVKQEPAFSLIHLDSVLRAVHLLPVFSKKPLPPKFDYHFSLDCFSTLYLISIHVSEYGLEEDVEKSWLSKLTISLYTLYKWDLLMWEERLRELKDADICGLSEKMLSREEAEERKQMKERVILERNLEEDDMYLEEEGVYHMGAR
ncbi:hypothetical protein VKT23_017874 [Stygiomarasmius scandens]|uniref:Uncharacterized protein n=1 Tax=Marasmiellus scandens TaxID=2682957 RepID=A0ABR1ITR4_9AGAR